MHQQHNSQESCALSCAIDRKIVKFQNMPSRNLNANFGVFLLGLKVYIEVTYLLDNNIPIFYLKKHALTLIYKKNI